MTALTDDQRLLRETLDRYLSREYALERPLAPTDNSADGLARHWTALVELGLTAVAVPTSDGGLGGGGVEVAIIAEKLGRHLVATPYLETAVVAATIGEFCRIPDVRARFFEALVGGAIVTLAHAEPDSRYDVARVAASARRSGIGYVLNGQKSSVVWGDRAGTLLVSARLDDGIAIFAVESNAHGVEIVAYPTNDGQGGADIRFADVQVGPDTILVGASDGLAAIERAIGRAGIFLACEAASIMRRMCDLTADYVKTRRQFGVPIGSFQTIQHRLVDMVIETEQSTSIAWMAASSWDAEPVALDRAASAARALAAQAGRFVGQNAVQLHGGIGMAWESPIAHYFKRLTMNGMQFGDESFHLRRFAASALRDRAA